jgi:hypothetical protein
MMMVMMKCHYYWVAASMVQSLQLLPVTKEDVQDHVLESSEILKEFC